MIEKKHVSQMSNNLLLLKTPNEVHQSFLNEEISLDSDDFEALVDAFRTLLQWSNDLEDDTEVK